jgi:ABC-type glycerol-3-phosphate transport system substrate-binding protein
MRRRHRPHWDISRRKLLKNSALAGAGIGLAGTGLIRPAHAAETTVTFAGWAFEPQVVEANVQRFMEQNPDIEVNYTPLDLQLYNEKMVALFNAGAEPDAFYVRDINLGAWVEAGWLEPIDGRDGLAELNEDMYPFNRGALFYKGKQYGTPYYGDIYVYMYDKKALADAGVTSPPVTLDQLESAALEVKKAGISDPQGLQDQCRWSRRVLVHGLRLGRSPVRRGAQPSLSGRGPDCAGRARVDARGHARLKDPGSTRARARRYAGPRCIPEWAGHLHL